jgi:putative FmdB family regulatory protein
LPLYEYECTKCGHRFEKIQKVSDPHVKTCPKCKGKVVRLLSAPAIQFKGSGWYITDYARKGQSGGDDKSSKSGEEKAGKASDESSKSEKASKEVKSSKTAKGSSGSSKKGGDD